MCTSLSLSLFSPSSYSPSLLLFTIKMSLAYRIPSFPDSQRLPVMPTPHSNNPDQLADFCAYVVPCIWGDGWAKLGTSTVDSKRYNMFRSFCKDIITATQISSSCILVSLRYIRVLRSCYPSIKGSVGSEFRLFTTSLILANKFLDDNTYTNKVCIRPLSFY